MLKQITIFTLFIILSANSYTENSLQFIVVGDWGAKGSIKQIEVANQMALWAQNNDVNFIISAGDNFYTRGVVSTTDEQWQTTFENVYTMKSLQVPWYVTLGNHDYMGLVQAQIDYTNLSKRWKMPSRYYSFDYNIDSMAKALFVIIDTSPLALSEQESYDFYDDVHMFNNNIQLNWLDSVLSSSNAKWKFVIGHHPVYSGGYHGPQQEMVKQIDPILIRNNVNIYFCGHDHDMQHLRNKANKINYFVSGAGADPRECKSTKNTLFYKGSTGGFLTADLSTNSIIIRFIDESGSEIYKTTLFNQ